MCQGGSVQPGLGFFTYTTQTEPGSSGCPLVLQNGRVAGIHQGSHKKDDGSAKINCGNQLQHAVWWLHSHLHQDHTAWQKAHAMVTTVTDERARRPHQDEVDEQALRYLISLDAQKHQELATQKPRCCVMS